MGFHVNFQVVHSSQTFPADVAQVEFFIAVCLVVLPQDFRVCEFFVAHVAFVWFLSRVFPFVNVERVQRAKRLVTNSARVGTNSCVRHRVLS